MGSHTLSHQLKYCLNMSSGWKCLLNYCMKRLDWHLGIYWFCKTPLSFSHQSWEHLLLLSYISWSICMTLYKADPPYFEENIPIIYGYGISCTVAFFLYLKEKKGTIGEIYKASTKEKQNCYPSTNQSSHFLRK